MPNLSKQQDSFVSVKPAEIESSITTTWQLLNLKNPPQGEISTSPQVDGVCVTSSEYHTTQQHLM